LNNLIKKERIPIVVLAMLGVLTGIWSGLTRIGWSLPIPAITVHHGAIMVGGFLGTLIILEKVIPLKNRSLLLIPVINALSVILFFLGQAKISIYILVLTSASLSLIFLYYFLTQRTIIYMLMLLGAGCWFVGNCLLLTKSFYPLAFPWWVGFALLIIAAERLELMRFLPVTKSDRTIFLSLLFAFVIGVLFSFHGTGNAICAFALVGVAIWLMRNDVIGINLKKKNLPKFVAFSLLCGYVALLLSGIFFIALPDHWLSYDAMVHSFFIGFVFSMIFAHGPIILPGVLGVSGSPFHPIVYVWLAALHISWLVRVFADIYVELELRKISGLISGVAIIGYFVTIAILMIRIQRNAEVR
jgi:hypothetical protein